MIGHILKDIQTLFAACFPAVMGMLGILVGLFVNRRFNLRDKQRERDQKNIDDEAAVRVAEVADDADIRRGLYERVNLLEKSLLEHQALISQLREMIFVEQRKNVECEQKYNQLETKLKNLDTEFRNQ